MPNTPNSSRFKFNLPPAKNEPPTQSIEAALKELEEWGQEEESSSISFSLEDAWPEALDSATLKEVAEQTNYGEIFLNDLINKQRALSISVAITFLVIIFSLPLFNFFIPSLTAFEIFGFEFSWLFLGLLSYPLIGILAFYFVTTANKYEDEFIVLVK